MNDSLITYIKKKLIMRRSYNILSQGAIVNYKKIEFYEASFYNICKFFNFVLEVYNF
jgi:hypothetical protein